MASLDEIIQDRVKHYNREITDLTSQAKSLGLSSAEISSLRVQAVRGRDKSKRYFEQHEQDLSQFQDAALDPIRQELGAQQKEILSAAARGEITSREQLETGSLAQTAAGNYRSALRRGERIAQLGSSALQAANRRAAGRGQGATPKDREPEAPSERGPLWCCRWYRRSCPRWLRHHRRWWS